MLLYICVVSKDSCLCFMLKIGQLAEFEWHITKAYSDSLLHMFPIRMTPQRPFSNSRQHLNEIALAVSKYFYQGLAYLACFFTLIYFCNILAVRILFKDKERKLEEIETKLQAEHDSLLLKSSNKVRNLSMSHTAKCL